MERSRGTLCSSRHHHDDVDVDDACVAMTTAIERSCVNTCTCTSSAVRSPPGSHWQLPAELSTPAPCWYAATEPVQHCLKRLSCGGCYNYTSDYLYNHLPLSISYSPIPSPITSSSSVSPLCLSITPSLFHSRLRTYLFHKSYSLKFHFFLPDCHHGLLPGPFPLSYRYSFFDF